MESIESNSIHEKKEKPEFLYSGTPTPGIEEFEPRKRFVPGGQDVGPRIYATGNPAFAAAHAFPWHSEEGIDLSSNNGKVVLKIPKQFEERLAQEVFIYTLRSDTFIETTEEETGETFHSEQRVKPQSCQRFSSVTEAMEYYGGSVEFLP